MQRVLPLSLILWSLALPLRGDDAIPAKTLADIKGATAFIKLKAGPLQATGSGFLIKADGTTGYVVTNHHVVVHNAPGLPKPQLTVVFHSGTKNELVSPAELLASDSDRDLAVLKVMDVKELPTPLDLTPKVDLVETLPVFMFGFPFGQALSLTKGHPAITVGKGTISSIRLNDREEVGVVQIDGDLNPGNSGGPVVDGKGRLVGVAVARVRGTRIGLAIPPAELSRMLNGRVSALGTKVTRINETTSDVEVNVTLIDPLNKIKEVTVFSHNSRELKEKPKADKETLWTQMPGEASKLKLEGQKATGKVRLTVKEKGLVPFSFQVACVTGEGKKLLTSLTPVDVDFGEATVVGKPPMGEKPPAVIFLKDKVVQSLPTIGDALIAGGGRWLIVHLSDKRKVLVWDVYQSKVAKELTLASDHVKLAAGMDKLIVVLPDQKLIQRWSLKTFEREATSPLRLKGKVTGAAMGSASSGPLCLAYVDDNSNAELAQFMDPLTLQPSELEWTDGKSPGITGAFLRAAPTGQLFTARQGVGGEPHHCAVLVVQGQKVKAHTVSPSGSLLLPTPDGKLLCSENAIYDADKLKTVFPREPKNQLLSPFLPAHQSIYFLRFEEGGKDVGKLSIFIPGQEKPLGIIEDVEGYVGQVIAYGKIPNPMMHDKRVFFVPDAKMLITIPMTNDRLVMRSIDVDSMMEKAGVDFLFVASQPPVTARENTLYTYQIKARSNKGGLKYKLESGPKGMKLSPQGLVEWEIPKKNDRNEQEVVIGITDAAGQEVFHTFTIVVE